MLSFSTSWSARDLPSQYWESSCSRRLARCVQLLHQSGHKVLIFLEFLVHFCSLFLYIKVAKIIGDLSRHADSYAVGKDDFADGMSHFHRVHPLSAGEDELPCVVVDVHRKKPSVLARRFLADLGLPVIEVAFIHSDLPAEGSGGYVALKEGLILRPKCVYRFHTGPYL